MTSLRSIHFVRAFQRLGRLAIWPGLLAFASGAGDWAAVRAGSYQVLLEESGQCGAYHAGAIYTHVSALAPLGDPAPAGAGSASGRGGYVGCLVDLQALEIEITPPALVVGVDRSVGAVLAWDDGTISSLPFSEMSVAGSSFVAWDAASGRLRAGSQAAGTVNLVFSARGAQTAFGLEVLQPEESFLAWQLARFDSGAGLLSPLSVAAADPDADGLSNLFEYAAGGNPAAPGEQSLSPSPETADGYLCLRFPRTLRSDLRQRVEASSDLRAWTTLWTADTPASGWQVVRDSAPLSSVPRRFLRLAIELK